MTTLQNIDTSAILETTEGAPRDKALRFREELIHLLRALEDMHDLPRSVPTDRERDYRRMRAVEHKK